MLKNLRQKIETDKKLKEEKELKKRNQTSNLLALTNWDHDKNKEMVKKQKRKSSEQGNRALNSKNILSEQ